MKNIFYIFLILSGTLYSQADLNNLTLRKYIEIVTKSSIDLKEAAAEISIEKANGLKEVSFPSPELGISYDFVPSGKNVSNYEERSLTFSQSFDFPLKYFVRSERNKNIITATEMGYENRKNNLLRNSKKLYYTALSNKYLLDTYKQHLESAEEFYAKSEIRKNAGESSSLELLTADIQLTESKSLYSNALSSYRASIIEMLSYGGISEEPDTIIFADTIKYVERGYDLNSILETALKDNNELNRYIYLGKTASENKKLAYLGLFPDFTLSYSKQSILGNNNYYGFQIEASIPLWFMFNNRAEINKSLLEEEIAGYNINRSRLEISRRIRTAYNEAKTKEEQVQLYQSSLLLQASAIYNIALLNYSAGESSYLELLQARQSVFTVKLNYINNLLNYYMALIELENSVNVPSFKILE